MNGRLKKPCLLISALLLSACAAMPSPQAIAYQEYIATNKPKAEQGSLSWSAYYEGVYSKAMAARAPATLLNQIIDMIDVAVKFEKGEISNDEFASARRRAQTAEIRDRQAYEDGERQRKAKLAADMAAAFSASAAQFQPIPYQIVQPTPIQPVQPIQPFMPTTSSVTATWTGRQEMVQTVTYQSGWNCEYNYAGRKFWRVFVTSCPSSIAIQ